MLVSGMKDSNTVYIIHGNIWVGSGKPQRKKTRHSLPSGNCNRLLTTVGPQMRLRELPISSLMPGSGSVFTR